MALKHAAGRVMASCILAVWAGVLCSGVGRAFEVNLDTSEVPELADWGQQAKELCEEWQPRLCHLLASKGYQPVDSIRIYMQKTDRGIADTGGGRIRISSGWVEQHPEDIGLVFHELVHVIQSYGHGGPGWLIEGIADYLRWAIYEGKPQEWFPVPDQAQGYRQSYRVCGGFLLWLESDRSPGIVKKLNTALRRGQYTETMFQEQADLPLDELWIAYVQDRKHPSGPEQDTDPKPATAHEN